MDKKLVLASASPRRRELMQAAGMTFDILVADVDETALLSPDPRQSVRNVAAAKARAVKGMLTGDAIIVSADTVVYSERIFMKPVDREDARHMLSELSGRTHTVYTGVCVLDTVSGEEILTVTGTDVEMREMTDEEIIAYIDTGEPMDKAGAYAIQGLGSAFIKGIKGDYDNVVGLPMNVLNEMLKKFEC